MLDASTQTHVTDVQHNPGFLEWVDTDTDSDKENLNKNEQFNLNNTYQYTYKSINDKSAERKFADVANNDTKLVKNNLIDKDCNLKDVALEDIKVKIDDKDDKGNLGKTGEDENTFSSSNRLSFKIKKKSGVTQKSTVRYRRSRRVLRRKKRSKKCDQPRLTGEEQASEETETESTLANESSLSDPSDRSDRKTVCRNTTMQPLKCGHENDCPEDSGCSFSSSYNDYEIDCHEMNRGNRFNSNLITEINNPKSNTARTDHQTGNTSIHRNTQCLNNVVAERELVAVKSTSTRRPQGPNAHITSNITLKDTQPSTPESMKKYSYNIADGDLNESYV